MEQLIFLKPLVEKCLFVVLRILEYCETVIIIQRGIKRSHIVKEE